MGLTTALDLATLGSWNLLTDFTGNQQTFIAVGKLVYQALRAYSPHVSLSPADLERPLAAALQVNTVFKTVCAAKRHASPSLYGVFATALARYIIDCEWQTVMRP
jgi:hypothetical protein